VIARVAGLASYGALAIALLTGIALRTAVLDWMGSNRALRAMHAYTTWLWITLGVVHIGGLLLDQTARIGVLDVLVPFRAPYGTLAVGLGTLSVDALIVVSVTAWMKRRIRPDWWRWLHRLSYVAFALMFLHAVLSGTDFSDPVVSAITWGIAAALLTLTVVRAVGGRLPESG
jgi:sulfoxide reductase heme-binding subunit YedZ